MVEFETLEEKEVALARGCLRVAAAKAISEKGETEFLSIRKVDDRGKFKQTLTIPKSVEVVDALVDALKSVV